MAPKKESILLLNINSIFFELVEKICRSTRHKHEKLQKKHSELGQPGLVTSSNIKSISYHKSLKKYHKSVQLILTSPPYLGIVNYAKQNWIRSWFLDCDPLKISETLDDDLNLDEWIKFSADFIEELVPFLTKNGSVVLVIGDVAKSKTSVIALAREFCMMVKKKKLFKNIWCFSDIIIDTDKTTRIWGDTKGSATATDRIVILSNINPFNKVRHPKGELALDFKFVEDSTKYFLGN